MRLRQSILVVSGLVSTLACNGPSAGDEIGDGDSDSSESDSGESDSGESDSSTSSSSSSTSDTSSTTSDTESDSSSSSSDTDCPPSESGCPCLSGTMCFPGLTCIEGFCFAPEDCTLEDPNVHVQWTYDIGGMQPPADTTCSITASMQGSGLALSIGGCADGVTTLAIALDPLPAELAPILGLADAPSSVRLHFEQATGFIRLAMPGYGLWLVDGSLIASGNAAVSDYPGEVIAALGECPAEPKFCGNVVGELVRRGVRVVGLPIYDGGSALVDPSLYAWVDLAKVDCDQPHYRFAIIDW